MISERFYRGDDFLLSIDWPASRTSDVSKCLKTGLKNPGEPLAEVEHCNCHVDDAFAGVGELCHNPPKCPFTFALSELSFHVGAVEAILTFESLLHFEVFGLPDGRLLRPT